MGNRTASQPNALRQSAMSTAPLDPGSTRMFTEAAQAAARVRLQLQGNGAALAELGAQLRALQPRAAITCARGSSDHAATFARYLIETRMGLLTSSASPSVSSVYGVQQDLQRCLFLAISQSGKSPDLLAATNAAQQAGATVVALVNVADSPLARSSRFFVPLHAGAETSVAATKSYIATLSAIVQLVASWSEDHGLQRALETAPTLLEQAWQQDWSGALDLLADAEHLLVIGRGLGLGLAQEAALKLKETCGLHAEAFSGAELRHGPMALLQGGVPVWIFVQDDETRAGLEQLARELVDGGTPVIVAGSMVAGTLSLPFLPADPAIAPLLLVQSFYRLANALALARGLDPDRPPFLKKVTETR
jgi:glucosamine--fructose-6-phosphate aminotransferase (isomerizing)